MPNNTASDLVDLLGQHRLLDPGPLEEVKSLQARAADSRVLLREIVQRGWMTPYQAAQIMQGRAADLTLGSYLILDLLGEGGAGQVFKARHMAMNRIVALKVLRKDLVSDKEVVARFFREIEVASHIAHPNIVHAYDAGPIGSALVLAMEFVDGVDLDKLVKENGKLPVGQACDYIRQAAAGLQHAHEKGLTHRDIKPSNLLVTTKSTGPNTVAGTVKILDLGLARLAHPAATSATKNLTVLAGNTVMQGTPDYMAPEQALDFHTADTRADIYSLGCTLFYVLAGQPPFPSGSLPEKLMKHQSAPPPPIDDFRKDVPTAVAEILKKMLAKRPADRFKTPGEVAQALLPFVPKKKSSLRIGDSGDAKSSSSSGVRAPSGVMQAPRRSQVNVANKKTGKLLTARPRRGRRLVVLTLIGTLLLIGTLAGLAQLLSSNRPGETTEPNTQRVASARTTREFNTAIVTSPAVDTRPKTKSGGGKEFKSKDDFIDVPHAPNLEPEMITVEAWVNPSEFPGLDDKRRWLVNKNVHEDTNGHYALMIWDKKVGAYLNVDGKFEAWSKEVLKVNAWQHLAMTYDGVALRVYYDGAEVALTVVDRKRKPGDKSLTIGRRQDGYDKSAFKGRLDDIRIYDRALKPEEIKLQWMRPDAPASEPGLILQQKF